MNTHTARKRFGQNFLHDPQIIQRIVDSLDIDPTDHFVEIGPGQGAITRPLLERCGKLDVIEIDRDLATVLQTADWFPIRHAAPMRCAAVCIRFVKP